MARRNNKVRVLAMSDGTGGWSIMRNGKTIATVNLTCTSDETDRYAFACITIRNKTETMDVSVTAKTMTVARGKPIPKEPK